MAKRILPDQAYLREVLDYDPETGVLTWKERPRSWFPNAGRHKRWNDQCANKRCGIVVPSGYLYVKIEGRLAFVHRVIWKWMTGNDPVAEIDHKNRNRSDNRFENLREATKKENCRNSAAKKKNLSSGLRGVEMNPKSGRFRAKIQGNGQRLNLGTFDTKEEAHAVWCVAARELYGDFWSPN